MTTEEFLLRYYYDVEGEGDYPGEWKYESQAPNSMQTGLPNDGPIILPRIPDFVREMRGNRCERCGHPYEKGMGEWSPCDERCTHGAPVRIWNYPAESWVMVADLATHTAGEQVDFEKAPIEAHWRILTVHHLDSDKANCRWWNLVALCQRCHLRMQRCVIMDREYHFEHTEWFKPYAAGFYAWKYQHQELTREEVMRGLDSLLKWEHKFTQEAIF